MALTLALFFWLEYEELAKETTSLFAQPKLDHGNRKVSNRVFTVQCSQ